MIKADNYQKLESFLGVGRLKKDFVLAPYTTFKMGGPAKYYFEAQTKKDLIDAVRAAYKLRMKFVVLGGASNVVISDKGFAGLVIRNLYVEKKVLGETGEGIILKVSSGYTISRLVKETIALGLSGLEYHMGLPGTVGGAAYMNSKWTRPVSYVGDCIKSAEIIDSKGKVKEVDQEYFKFAYDSSILQKTKEILISATFFLKKADKSLLEKRAHDSLEYRRETQPHGVASSGCFFRNHNGKSAGKIIDELKLKGFTMGNLYISDKHANFVINRGGGTSKDFFKLVGFIKKKAHEKMGLNLKEEVVLIE